MNQLSRKTISALFLFIFFTTTGFTFVFPAWQTFREAKAEYKTGNTLFAILSFRHLLAEYPHSNLSIKAQFALGECLFETNASQEAYQVIQLYTRLYPQQKNIILAKIYMLKILSLSTTRSDQEVLKSRTAALKKQLYDKPFFIAYRDYKRRLLTSPLGHKFELREYVDSIEVYRNGQLFFKILP